MGGRLGICQKSLVIRGSLIKSDYKPSPLTHPPIQSSALPTTTPGIPAVPSISCISDPRSHLFMFPAVISPAYLFLVCLISFPLHYPHVRRCPDLSNVSIPGFSDQLWSNSIEKRSASGQLLTLQCTISFSSNIPLRQRSPRWSLI